MKWQVDEVVSLIKWNKAEINWIKWLKSEGVGLSLPIGTY
jgi:hypothetical protein